MKTLSSYYVGMSWSTLSVPRTDGTTEWKDAPECLHWLSISVGIISDFSVLFAYLFFSECSLWKNNTGGFFSPPRKKKMSSMFLPSSLISLHSDTIS